MSLLSNIANVSFASQYPVDKIVNVWEGSFNGTTQTTNRTAPFAGSIDIFAIAHGFTRPVFVDLLWSSDNITWEDGGSSSIAFSDSTNIYIVAGVSGTNYYKAIATWIDTYDGTNPLVNSFGASDTTIFDSRVNYQKIFMQGELTYAAGTFGSSTTVSAVHGLGYIPNGKAFFEPIAGEVWPLNSGGTANPFLYNFSQDEALMTLTSTAINIQVARFSNATRKVWYKVYLDE